MEFPKNLRSTNAATVTSDFGGRPQATLGPPPENARLTLMRANKDQASQRPSYLTCAYQVDQFNEACGV
jgi:hypothetical protein